MGTRVEYEGRVQLGTDDRALEVVARIPDVEHPEWFGYIDEPVERLRGEIAVSLLDGGIYNAWQGSALVRDRRTLHAHRHATPRSTSGRLTTP